MSFVMLNQGEPDRVDTGVVSANFFEMLGITPALGRTFIDTDDDLGVEPVLRAQPRLLAAEVWRRQERRRQDRRDEQPHAHHRRRAAGLSAVPAQNDVYMPTSACPFRAQGGADDAAEPPDVCRAPRVRPADPGATAERASAEIGTIASGFDDAYPRDYQRARNSPGGRSRSRSSWSATRGRCCSRSPARRCWCC